MAFNTLIFTCKRNTLCALYSGFFHSTNRLLKQCKKNYLISSLTYSSDSPNKDNMYDSPEMRKYLYFLQNNISVLSNTVTMNEFEAQKMSDLLENKKKIELELEGLDNMNKEEATELKELVEEERDNLKKKLFSTVSQFFENITILEEDDDDRNVEIQIIPGIGGVEAKLFAEELYNMYIGYARYKNWECPVAEIKSQNSEFTTAYIVVHGSFVYKYLKHEGGVHRVQRVPETERQGRTHTSTCSVIVLPQPKSTEVQINPKDIVVEKTTSSGPGGQNVNKRETSVRIKHLPTGVVIECQESRFQFRNKELGLERLRGVLYNMELQKLKSERQKSKKEQGGTNDYSDKIRTYNFNQNRITDHRINYSLFHVKQFLQGEKALDEMIDKLKEDRKKTVLLEHVRKVLQSVEYKDFEKKKVSN